MAGNSAVLVIKTLTYFLLAFVPVMLVNILETQVMIMDRYSSASSSYFIDRVRSVTLFGDHIWFEMAWIILVSFIIFTIYCGLVWDPSPLVPFSQKKNLRFILAFNAHKVFIAFAPWLMRKNQYIIWDWINFVLSAYYCFYVATRINVIKGNQLFMEDLGVILLFQSSAWALVYRNSASTIDITFYVLLIIFTISLTTLLYQHQIRSKWEPKVIDYNRTSKLDILNELLKISSVITSGDNEYRVVLMSWLVDSVSKIHGANPFDKLISQTFLRKFERIIKKVGSKKNLKFYLYEVLDSYIDNLISMYLEQGITSLEDFYLFKLFFLASQPQFRTKAIIAYFEYRSMIDQYRVVNRFIMKKLLCELAGSIKETQLCDHQTFNIDLHKNLRINDVYQKMQKSIRANVAAGKAFWFEFQRECVSMVDAFEYFAMLCTLHRKIKAQAQVIMEYKIFFKEFIISYLNYTDLVVMDKIESSCFRDWIAFNFDIKNTKKFDIQISDYKFDDRNEKFYFFVDGNSRSFGIINYVSEDSLRLLKHKRENLIGIHIDTIKPSFIGGYFQQRVVSESGENGKVLNTSYSNYVDVYLQANKKIVPAITTIKKYIDIKKGPQYLVVSSSIQALKPSHELFVCFDVEDGIIFNSSDKLTHFVNIDSLAFLNTECEGENVNIRDIFPTVHKHINDDFFKGNPIVVRLCRQRNDTHQLITASRSKFTFNEFMNEGGYTYTSLQKLTAMKTMDAFHKNLEDEGSRVFEELGVEIKHMATYEKNHDKIALVRCRKLERGVKHVNEELENKLAFKKGQTGFFDKSFVGIHRLIYGNTHHDIPQKLAPFLRLNSNRLVIKVMFCIYAIVILCFVTFSLIRFQDIIGQIRTCYSESNALSAMTNIFVNLIKKADIDMQATESPSPSWTLDFNQAYFPYTSTEIDDFAELIDHNYGMILNNFINKFGNTYIEIDENAIQNNEEANSLLITSTLEFVDLDGTALNLSYSELMTYVSLTATKFIKKSLGQMITPEYRQSISLILETMNTFWETNLNFNINLITKLNNDLAIFQLIEISVVLVIILAFLVNTEIIQKRMSRLFYCFLHFTKDETKTFLAYIQRFEEDFDPMKGSNPNPVEFEQEAMHTKTPLIAKPSSLDSFNDDITLTIANEHDAFSSPTKSLRESQLIRNQRRRDDPEYKQRKYEMRVRIFSRRSLDSNWSKIIRNSLLLVPVIIFGIIYYQCFKMASEASQTTMRHFNVLSHLQNNFQLLKNYSNQISFDQECEQCKERFQEHEQKTIFNFKQFIEDLDKMSVFGLNDYLSLTKSVSQNLCSYSFDNPTLNKMLKDDCSRNDILGKGFEIFAMNLCTRYSNVLSNQNGTSSAEFKQEIIIKEFWIFEAIKLFKTEFGTALIWMVDIEQMFVNFLKVGYIVFSTVMIAIILLLRFRHQNFLLEINKFIVHFLASPITSSNKNLQEYKSNAKVSKL